MAKLTASDEIPDGPAASAGGSRSSIWSAIHPRLLELIRAHRSTLIFVNSRRLAERLAGALNELAGETLVRSHHGSIARAQRVEIEDLLKAGALRALVAPSSLDIVAQQIVAMTSMDRWDVDELFATIRRAAPFAELSRDVFDGVLDMLSGRYPSDEFAELRPRVTWDRVAGTVIAREGAKRVAIANGGTIPDRGLYGVFLVGAGPGAARVGELDEEMVFESRVGETFVLGASSWRIHED